MTQMNLLNRNKTRGIENRLVTAKWAGVEEGRSGKFGISECIVVYTEWINKALLYSTENYIKYPVINHKRKEYENECTYMCNWVTLLYSSD